LERKYKKHTQVGGRRKKTVGDRDAIFSTAALNGTSFYDVRSPEIWRRTRNSPQSLAQVPCIITTLSRMYSVI